jgi:hypothetical protein
MWTLARGLRMAHVESLNRSEGRFDWEQNIDPKGPAEGFWPYLVREQADNGSWYLDKAYWNVSESICTGWALLCLSEGVVGYEGVIHDVKATAKVPKDGHIELIAESFKTQTPEITEQEDH